MPPFQVCWCVHCKGTSWFVARTWCLENRAAELLRVMFSFLSAPALFLLHFNSTPRFSILPQCLCCSWWQRSILWISHIDNVFVLQFLCDVLLVQAGDRTTPHMTLSFRCCYDRVSIDIKAHKVLGYNKSTDLYRYIIKKVKWMQRKISYSINGMILKTYIIIHSMRKDMCWKSPYKTKHALPPFNYQ